MRPAVCVPCRLFFKPKKNGVFWEEGAPRGETWSAYKLWSADLWECKGCGAQIIIGMGQLPVAEHYQPDYERFVEATSPMFRVDDC